MLENLNKVRYLPQRIATKWVPLVFVIGLSYSTFAVLIPSLSKAHKKCCKLRVCEVCKRKAHERCVLEVPFHCKEQYQACIKGLSKKTQAQKGQGKISPRPQAKKGPTSKKATSRPKPSKSAKSQRPGTTNKSKAQGKKSRERLRKIALLKLKQKRAHCVKRREACLKKRPLACRKLYCKKGWMACCHPRRCVRKGWRKFCQCVKSSVRCGFCKITG